MGGGTWSVEGITETWMRGRIMKEICLKSNHSALEDTICPGKERKKSEGERRKVSYKTHGGG